MAHGGVQWRQDNSQHGTQGCRSGHGTAGGAVQTNMSADWAWYMTCSMDVVLLKVSITAVRACHIKDPSAGTTEVRLH